MASQNPVSDTLIVKELGSQAYLPIWQAMKDFTDTRDENTLDECWLVEHEPVFTQGQAGKSEHILQHNNIPVVQCDRGGQVTYHGPGQAMLYCLVDIKRKKIGVRDFVTIMEQAVISLLSDLGIEAGLKEGAPGVYVKGAKISALGLRVRRGATYHGLALNVDMDLSPFLQINPCGYEGMVVTDIKTLLTEKKQAVPTMAEINQQLLEKFSVLLHYSHIQYV
ncbi:MAG: lipoyl(octanoyl) transferase LipB [Pseudomonadales bacterium]|nr:lipoyl(octanoyl) transferase LipB [Pseudomonadales bacterium]